MFSKCLNSGHLKTFNVQLFCPSPRAFDTRFCRPGLCICALAGWWLWLWIMSQLSSRLGESTIIPGWPGWGSPLLPVPFQMKNIKQLEFRTLYREFRQNIRVPNLATLDLSWFMIDWFLNCLFNPNDSRSRGDHIPRSHVTKKWREGVVLGKYQEQILLPRETWL